MTSQKSSISTFNFTFLSALKGNFILPLINMAALIIAVPVACIITIKNYSTGYLDPASSQKVEEVRKITDYYKYLIFSDFTQGSANVFLHLSVVAFSVLLGVVMFRFIAGKKTVNVFYSLGITRKNLFVSKYLAGILMLGVSIAVPFLACLVVNISTFGSSKELWSAILYHIIGYCALSFTAFSLTAAVFSGVGTIIEGITFSGILLLGPTMVIYSLQFLMGKLVLGSPFGYFRDENFQVTNDLATMLSGFNPLLFLFKNLTLIGELYRENPEDKFVWLPPDYAGIFLWAAIAAALFLLGITLFQKRKAEICGFLGTNKWLNFVVTFTVGFFPLSLVVTTQLPVTVSVLIGLAIYLVLYSIIDFALIRNIKEWVRGLYKLPVHLGLALLIVLIFATGLFGFSSRIPEIEKIESAEILPVAYPGIIDPYSSSLNYGDDSFIVLSSPNEMIDGFKSTADLQTVTGLHKLFVDAGKLTLPRVNTGLPVSQQIVRTDFKVAYHLKNGRTLSRYYNLAYIPTIAAVLAVDTTDRYDELIIQNLTQPMTDSDSFDIKANKTVFQSDMSLITIAPGAMNTAVPVDLTPEKRVELLNALAADMKDQTVEERFYPADPAAGVIVFRIDPVVIEEKFGYVPDTDMQGTLLSLPLVNWQSASIVITGDMERTLDFMNANGLTALIANPEKPEFVSAQILYAAKISSINDYYFYGSSESLHFMGGWNKESNEYGSFGGAYKTTDKAIVDEIAANAHISYFNSAEGYFVKFEIGNSGGYTTMYVPASKIPQSVIDAVDKHVQIRPDYPMEKYAY